MPLTDEELYARYLNCDDNDALRCLLERYREGLALFLFGFVRNAEDAEELTLDAFAEVAAGPTVFSGKSSFKTWLFSIGKHLALAHVRKQKRLGRTQGEISAQDSVPPPETELLRQEQKSELYRALGRIAPEYREVLLLQFVEQMTPSEIAQVMGKRIKQVYNLIERGKNALRSELERMGFEYAQY